MHAVRQRLQLLQAALAAEMMQLLLPLCAEVSLQQGAHREHDLVQLIEGAAVLRGRHLGVVCTARLASAAEDSLCTAAGRGVVRTDRHAHGGEGDLHRQVSSSGVASRGSWQVSTAAAALTAMPWKTLRKER